MYPTSCALMINRCNHVMCFVLLTYVCTDVGVVGRWRITAVERGQADVCGVCLAAFRGLPDPCDPDTTTRPSWLQGLYSMAQRVPPIVLTVAWTSTTATLLYVIFRLKFEQEMARQALYLSVYNDFSSSFAALSVIDSGGVL
eukprot:m.45275 g.45275  ORF g.45275 m.45275 type:complete len:142 (-) comp6630_c0_seq1:51-476(-)